MTGAQCLNGGHGYDFDSYVGHSRLDSIGLLVYDGMHTYLGAGVVFQVPRGSADSVRNGLISWV